MRLILDRKVRVPTRDGTELATDILRPDVGQRVPVVLKRTPYDRGLMRVGDLTEANELAERGYAVLSQDVRGRYGSGGTFQPFEQEILDGYDAVEWAAAQPWSTGRVAMHGASYLGATQWLAAMAAPPSLRAIAPNITSSDYHEGWAYQGGAFQLGFLLYWSHSDFTAGNPGPPDEDRAEARREALDSMDRLYRRRPLTDFPLLRRWAPFYEEWLRRSDRDARWRSVAPNEHYERISVPALNIGGWYDIFLAGTVENYVGARARAATSEARLGQRLVIGPWSHRTIQSTGDFADRRYGVRATVGSTDLAGAHARWFDHWLNGTENGTAGEAPVRVFVMGRNEWRDYSDWPIPEAVLRPLYLHSGGRSNTSSGDGVLSWEAPAASEPDDAFVFDPLDPVPSAGGPTLSQAGMPGWNAGPYDQCEIEARTDVLCYTTGPLQRALDVVGPIELVLYASSSAPDTDFTAKLVDVWPTGRAENLTDGILRARYREGLEAARLLEPGQVHEFRISLGPTANTFLPGHRIRLEVSSSNFPRFDPNPNTGRPVADEPIESLTIATNRVLHDRARPSHLVLPIVTDRD